MTARLYVTNKEELLSYVQLEQGIIKYLHVDAEALDALVAPLSVSPSSDEVRDQDEDDQQGKSDSNSDGNDVVRHVVTIHWSLKGKEQKCILSLQKPKRLFTDYSEKDV